VSFAAGDRVMWIDPETSVPPVIRLPGTIVWVAPDEGPGRHWRRVRIRLDENHRPFTVTVDEIEPMSAVEQLGDLVHE